jgi:hypothetical protein
MVGHSKGGQGLKRAVITQKEKKKEKGKKEKEKKEKDEKDEKKKLNKSIRRARNRVYMFEIKKIRRNL